MIAEYLLKLFSRPMPEAKADPSARTADTSHALDAIHDAFEDFSEVIMGRNVLDFGCGYGEQTEAMAAAGARRVLGYDVWPDAIEEARQHLKGATHDIADRVEYTASLHRFGQHDVVVSQNSFEHFMDPNRELLLMKLALRPGGLILITFGPPWRSPWGAHMKFWCRLPWIQNAPLSWLFTERAVMKVRESFRRDKAGVKTTYRSVGLNQITVAKFEEMIKERGLHLRSRRYSCCWGLDWLQHVPLGREWTINHISVVLERR